MRRACAFALLPLAFAGWGASPASAADPHVDQVESGLTTKYYIAGRPVPAYTLADRMRFYRVPAVSIAVVDDYRIAWARAYGLRDVAANAPAEPGTLFQAASMSKPVFAAAILRLFQQRGLRLDADVNTMLKTWHVPPPRAGTDERVTLRRLLSHTAGVNVHGFIGYDRDAPLPSLLQVLDGTPPANSEAIRVTSVPGSAAEYSGGGTTIAQQLAVDVTGQPFPDFMQATLLGPLGMNDSTYAQPLPQPLWPHAADGYYADGSSVYRGWHVYPTMAAAGLWTTSSDLATFIIAIQNALRGQANGPIDATIAHDMTTPVMDSYALGLVATGDYFSHDGANEGFQGRLLGLMQGGRGLAIMTNSDNGILLANEITHAVATAYGWPILKPAPKTPLTLSRSALAALAGTYRSGGGSDVSLAVRLEGDALVLRTSSDKIDARLYPETPTRFFTLGGGMLTFSHGSAGKPASITVGDDTYTRVP